MDDEIGCMCEKCTCSMTVPLVTSICDSCLKDNHVYQIPAELKGN